MTGWHDHPEDEPCGGWCRAYTDSGRRWCRPCREWHRGPECVIDEEGEPDLDKIDLT